MYSRLESFSPPFLAFVSGVRRASVMTTSSAFFEVLCRGGVRKRQSLSRERDAHLGERAARRQVLEDGADAFNSHCCG
jgi:hypothetical protein